MTKMKIAVAGMGYVGLSNALLLAQSNSVRAYDVSADRIDQINRRECPLDDPEMVHFFSNLPLDLEATTHAETAFKDAQFIIISTPTNYDVETHKFDTSKVESVIVKAREIAPEAYLVIKSTIPVGYVASARKKFNTEKIIFSPEFLREGKALHDNLYPSRIIVGDKGEAAKTFAELLRSGSKTPDAPVLFTDSSEAEAIKLFSNTYLAMRVAYFNELDSYGIKHNLNMQDIIEGMGHDPRIGAHYNNPSFGYGGYCLPKDTKQLLANFDGVPQSLIGAIVSSNELRKDYLLDNILRENPKTVGIHRLAMKAGADNYRDSAILGLISRLLERGVEVIIFEPTISESNFMGCRMENIFDDFVSTSDLIVSNRMEKSLAPFRDKVFSRDIFGAD